MARNLHKYCQEWDLSLWRATKLVRRLQDKGRKIPSRRLKNWLLLIGQSTTKLVGSCRLTARKTYHRPGTDLVESACCQGDRTKSEEMLGRAKSFWWKEAISVHDTQGTSTQNAQGRSMQNTKVISMQNTQVIFMQNTKWTSVQSTQGTSVQIDNISDSEVIDLSASTAASARAGWSILSALSLCDIGNSIEGNGSAYNLRANRYHSNPSDQQRIFVRRVAMKQNLTW